MEKAVHYTERERMLLAQLIFEEKAIKNKKTGATDLKEKADAWERIVKKYASEGCTPRTSKQLKKCWDNMKQKKRKLNTAVRHDQLMTGGGPASVQFNDPVIAFMDATNANLDIEVDCTFDSTAVFEKEYNVRMDCTKNKLSTKPTFIIENKNDQEDENNNGIIDHMVDMYDPSIPSTSNSTLLENRASSNIKNINVMKKLKLINY